MVQITAKTVKDLREKTGAGMMDCKNALKEADGDLEKAVDILRTKGIAKAAKKASRETSEGIVSTYIHHDKKLGAMVEINCETDFVARNEDFISFTNEVAMQVAVSDPLAVGREDMPKDIVEKEMDIYMAEARESGRPENILEKIATGKMDKFYKENCLLEQEYFKDGDKNINDLLTEVITKVGENIVVKRFTRFKIGE